MADQTADGASEKRRGRPSHWTHPVNEDRRQARARKQRFRRIVLAALILLVVGVISAYSYLTSDARVKAYAVDYLEKDLVGTHVSIGRASFSFGEGLVLEDLRIVPPAPFKDPLLVAERVDLRIDPLSLLLLSPRVTEVVVHRPAINIVLWNERKWNFQALTRTRPLAEAAHFRPVVSLQDGTLRIERKIEVAADGVNEVVIMYQHQMQVSGLLLPSETESDTFRFQTDVRSQSVHLAVTSGLIDARTGGLRFEGQASNVALTRDLYLTLPREAQRIWDRFEPTGSVNIKVMFNEKEDFRLEADLTGVRFTRKYNNLTYSFEDLTGRCTFFQPMGLRLVGVQGLLNGTPMRLSGVVTGFDDEKMGMDLSIQADNVNFEECREALVNLAPVVEAVYDMFSPRGRFDVDLVVRRAAGEGTPLDVTGKAVCRDVEMTYSGFPYRLERMTGTVEFGPKGFETKDLEGRHGPAVIRMEGWGRNPGPQLETRMRVRAKNLALDEDLRAALSPGQRRAYDQYEPGGTADADVEVVQSPESGGEPEMKVLLDLLDCHFRCKGFPYLLTETTGRLDITPKRTELVDVRGKHGQASVVLSGEILATKDPDRPQVHLKVVGRNVSLDEDLSQALPERDRKVLAVFHLSGAADIEGTVSAGPATKGELDYDLDIRLKGARMIYEPFPFLAEQVTGQLHLAQGACRIDSITGFNSGARIEARGWIEQRPDDYAMDLVLVGTDVTLGESLRGALGPEMRSAWSHLAPQGRVDINAHIVKTFGADAPVKHHVWVTAREVQARLDVFPYPLEHVTGQLEFEGAEVRLHDIKARTGMTEFAMDGWIRYAPAGPDLDLAIKTQGLRLEGPLRSALPRPLQQAFDNLHPSGRVDMNLSRLTYRTTGPLKAEAAWSGTAILDEVGLAPGVKIAGLVGTAELQGKWTDDKVALEGRLRIQQGKIADKDISDARMIVEKHPDSSAIVIRSIEGEFYGGRMEGSASIRIEPPARYALSVAATDVDFERLLKEGFRLGQSVSGGRMRATLALWNRGPDGMVEASGYADVADAKLYQTPVVVRVLAVLQMAPADQTAFEKARVLYFWRGQRLYLGDVRLEGRAMNLYGAGVLEPDNQLHMTFLLGKKNDDPLIPALWELMEGIRHELAVVLVTGTPAEPQVEIRSLSTLTAPFRELLRLVSEQRKREAAGQGK